MGRTASTGPQYLYKGALYLYRLPLKLLNMESSGAVMKLVMSSLVPSPV